MLEWLVKYSCQFETFLIIMRMHYALRFYFSFSDMLLKKVYSYVG